MLSGVSFCFQKKDQLPKQKGSVSESNLVVARVYVGAVADQKEDSLASTSTPQREVEQCRNKKLRVTEG
jgi:hypothetical protein